MCIIIHKPEGEIVTEAILQKCHVTNRDGSGFMYTEDNKVVIIKGLFSFEEFINRYREHQAKNLVIHFRIKTQGNISTMNAHPFAINKFVGFAHNGHITTGYTDADMSDSYIFNQVILKHLPNNWWKDKVILKLMGDYIGYSKLAILTGDNKVVLVNEKAGHRVGRIWYSNTSYQDYTAQHSPRSHDRNNYKEKQNDSIGNTICRVCHGTLYNEYSTDETAKNCLQQFGLCVTCLRCIQHDCGGGGGLTWHFLRLQCCSVCTGSLLDFNNTMEIK